MRTKLPISTISYNSPAYLETKLREWHSARLISEWYFIEHLPEDDEAGNKKHMHVLIYPAKQLQTEDLIQDALELDPEHVDKPFKCLPYRITKNFGDWYLYAIHDRAYLAMKGQSRRYHYTIDDMVTFDEDQLRCRVHEIDMFDKSSWKLLETFMKEGLTFAEVLARGAVPIQQFSQYRQAYEYMVSVRTNRGGRKGHEPDIAERDVEIASESQIAQIVAILNGQTEEQKTETWCGATREEWAELYESANKE